MKDAWARVLRGACWFLFCAVIAAGCGGNTGGFPSGLGGGLVNGAKRPVFIFFGALPANGQRPMAKGRAVGRSNNGPGYPIPLIPPPGATVAYVSMQGAGYLGSNIYFKPVLFPNSLLPNPNGDLTTSPLMSFGATVTTAANSATQTLSSVTNLSKGSWLQFGSDPVLRQIIQTPSGLSVTLDSAVTTTVGELVTAGNYVPITVPTHTTDALASPTDPGVEPALFNMGFTRLILVDYQDDAGHELGVATFSINPDPPTGGQPTVFLNDNTRIPTNPPQDLTPHEGRLVQLPVDVSGLPLVTPASAPLSLPKIIDLAKSVVFTITEQVPPSEGLTANTFTQVVDTQLSDYLPPPADGRTLAEKDVLVADRGFPFTLTVQVFGGTNGQGALVASGTPVGGAFTLPKNSQIPSQAVSVTRNPDLALVATAPSDQFLLTTVSGTTPTQIAAILSDGSNQSLFSFPGQSIALSFTYGTTINSATPPPFLTETDAKKLNFEATASGTATVSMTLTAAPNGDPYFFSLGPIPIQTFDNSYKLIVSNFSAVYAGALINPGDNTISVPSTLDNHVPFTFLNIALENAEGSVVPVPATDFTVAATFPNPNPLLPPPIYPNLFYNFLNPADPTIGWPSWLDHNGAPGSTTVEQDPSGKTLSTQNLIFRAINTSVSQYQSDGQTPNPAWALAPVLQRDLPITITYTGTLPVSSSTNFIDLTLHATGGSVSGGGG